MQHRVMTDLGMADTISSAEFEKRKHLLPTFQREWDTDVLARYRVGLLGGLSALTPRIVVFVRYGKRVEQRTLLVSAVTAGSDLWVPKALELCERLRLVGLPAIYDSTVVEDMPWHTMQERAALEIEALVARLARPVPLSPDRLALIAR